MRITDKSLHKEIREFNNRQKLNIAPEMFFLWEYKLTKTDNSRNSLFDILKSDNVYLKLANSEIKKISDINSDEFFFMLSLYKEHNIKLANFCSKMIKDFN
jgi:hypothetical protein